MGDGKRAILLQQDWAKVNHFCYFTLTTDCSTHHTLLSFHVPINFFLSFDMFQGHYRFCDALFFLGARNKAVEANCAAQRYCSADPEGMRDLLQQSSRFRSEISEGKCKDRAPACSEGDQAHF